MDYPEILRCKDIKYTETFKNIKRKINVENSLNNFQKFIIKTLTNIKNIEFKTMDLK